MDIPVTLESKAFHACRPLEQLLNIKTGACPNGVPKIIHQTWKTDSVPEKWIPSANAWRSLHPTWLYLLWTDHDIETYIKISRPHAWSLFQRLAYNIQRVDLFRYFVLHDFGGVYSDLDIMPKKSIEGELSMAQGHVFLVKSANTSSNFTNAIMASNVTPEAKQFWASMIYHVDTWPTTFMDHVLEPIRHYHIMSSTGPLALTRVTQKTRIPVTVLPQHIWNPYDVSVAGELHLQNDEASIIQILKGSSWHEVDSTFFNFVNVHKWQMITLASLTLVYTLLRLQLIQRKFYTLMRLVRKKKVITP